MSPPAPGVGVNADLPLDLRTDVAGGSELDKASGRITLAGNSKFQSGDWINVLKDQDCTVIVSGVVSPIP